MIVFVSNDTSATTWFNENLSLSLFLSLSHSLSIYLSIDFLLRRLIIKCVCYFPEFVSFKTFRETSFERIWARLYCFGNTFWHPFGEKLGPFWGVGSRPHFGPLLELLFWIFGAPGLPRRNPFWKPFRFMLPSRGALRLKIEDFGGVWLQSFFLFKEILYHFGMGSWPAKTLISHGRGSQNHNSTEVRILPLFNSIF